MKRTLACPSSYFQMTITIIHIIIKKDADAAKLRILLICQNPESTSSLFDSMY